MIFIKWDKIFICTIILLAGCICVGSTFAADVSVSDVNNDVNLLSANADLSQKDIEINNLQAGKGSFTDLETEIKSAEEGATINLTKDYVFTDGDTPLAIGIFKSITIDGKGHTIDGNYSNSIFYLGADNIILKNINFVNAYDTHNGGAILIANSATVTNCNFTNCKSGSDYKGGAICIFDCPATVEGCNFVNCSAKNGGAIYCGSPNSTVDNCKFLNCSATNGGAIYWEDIGGSITNCNFSNNLAKDEGNSIFVNASNIYIYGNQFTHTDENGADCEIYLGNNATGADLIENVMLTKSPSIYYYAVHIGCGEQFGDWADVFLKGNNFKNNCIYNEGEITSPIKMVFGSKVVKKGEKALITGTIYDDNGNYILSAGDVFAYLNDNLSKGYIGIPCDLFYYFHIPTKDLKPGVYKLSSSIQEENDNVTFEGNLTVLPVDKPNPKPNPKNLNNQNGIPMEHTGNPLFVLLISLVAIGLGSLKGKL